MKIALLTTAIVLAAATPAAAVNLITNGDFASGTAGWTTTNGTHYTDGNGFHEGAVGTTDYLSQAFSDTTGYIVTVDFDFSSNAGYQYVQYNGVTVPGSLVDTSTATTHYTFTLGKATGSDTVTFAGQNNPSYNTLDHVVVTEIAAVPEPASWAFMVVGFGLIGATARRKAVVAA